MTVQQISRERARRDQSVWLGTSFRGLLMLCLGLIGVGGFPALGQPTAARLTLGSTNQATVKNGQFGFRLQGEPNVVYSIQASPNLRDWTPVATYQSAATGMINLVDPEAGGFRHRFYRAFSSPRDATSGVTVPIATDPNRIYILGQPQSPPAPQEARFHPTRILVRPKAGVALGVMASVHLSVGSQVLRVFPKISNLQVLELSAGTDARKAVQAYQASGLVEYAELDYVVRALAEPNDFRFKDGSLWNMHNVGQNGGTPDADIDAPEAWDTRSGSPEVIVAVIDTGIRYTHEDLAANMWKNPGEIAGNGRDDDNNGYVDDVYGINAIRKDGDPMDDHGHGSHVGGIIGAVGNNELGVVGVAWKVQLMACKFITAQADGALSDAITCIDYARTHGAHIINASWGMPQFNTQALRDAIESARAAGIIFVAAAGNSSGDNEQAASAVYPASYDLDNIVSVLATTSKDELAFFTNYGATTVDLAAPGQDVFSCWNGSDSNYQFFLGTSMSSAHVSGACALAKAQFPSEAYRQIINRILGGADPIPSLAGKCVTGGRLNIKNVLGNSQPPPSLPILTVRASDEKAAEAGADPGEFTISRTGDTASALTVQIALSGTAASGTDCKTIEPSVTIAAGAASAAVKVEPLDDAAVEGNETLILTLKADVAYTVGTPDTATVTIEDNDTAPPSLPIVTVRASDEKAAEAGVDPGEFTISRTGDTAAALTVQFALSGTAANGTDYKTLEPSVTIAAGAASAAVKVEPLDDAAVEGNETLILTLKPDAAYTVGTPDTATVTIEDNDTAPPALPIVTVGASDEKAAEAGVDPGEFTISRTGDTASALTVQIALSGTAANGTDYKTVEPSVTIAAGAASAAVKVEPLDDPAVEGNETVILTLKGDSAYTVGTPNNASVAIQDNDQGTITADFTASPTSGSVSLTVQFTDQSTGAVVAWDWDFGDGSPHSSSQNPSHVYNTPGDFIVTLTVRGGVTAGGGAASTSSKRQTIHVTERTTVSLSISVALISEGDANGVDCTIVRTGDTSAALTVRIALGGTASTGIDFRPISDAITIPAGASSVKIKLVPIDDSIIELPEAVIVTLKSDPAYDVGLASVVTVVLTDNDLLGLGPLGLTK